MVGACAYAALAAGSSQVRLGAVVVFAIIVFFVAVCVIAWYFSWKRQKAIEAWAISRGFRFSQERDGSIEYRFPFPCLRDGSNRYGHNISVGEWCGRPICAFDYHYQTESGVGKNRRTNHYHFSAVIVDSGLPLHPLLIRPEGIFDKITEFFGYDDIDFESSEFSRKFYVKSPDKRWAFDVISQKTMEFLLEMPRFRVELLGTYVIARSGCRTFSAGSFDPALLVASGIIERLPEYLLREMKGDRNG